MPIISDITQGTISVAADGTAVTGVGTAFLTAGFQEGDLLFANGFTGVVLSVTTNTALTLAQPWKGGALSGAPYRLRYQGDASRLTAMARQLITMLGMGGNIEALAGLVGAANRFPVFTGAGTMDIKTIAPYVLSLLDDPDAATFYATLGQIPNAQVRNDLAADKAFRRGNILASVAQAAGVPTGGLIERGSNANGEYARFADGTQICTATDVALVYSSSTRLVYAWTLPVSFPGAMTWAGVMLPASGAAYVNLSIQNCGASWSSRSASTIQIGINNAGATNFASNSQVTGCSLLAIGRWY